MEAYILNTSFAVVAVIDSYQSFIWTERYYEAGDCELYVPASVDPYFSYLKVGNFITKGENSTICRIVSVEVKTSVNNGQWVLVKGKDARTILNQRVCIQQAYSSAYAKNIISTIISNNVTSPSQTNRKITMNVNTGISPNDTYYLESDFFYVFDKIVEICRQFGYGSKMTWSKSAGLSFSLYVGYDHSASQNTMQKVIFSEDFDALAESDYISDITGLKTAAYIAGEGDGTDRQIVQINTGSGINRYELFVDAKSLSKKDSGGELTPTQYTNMLTQYGTDQLEAHGVVITFSGTVINNVTEHIYGTDYGLGDIVTVESPFGISYDVRVTEAIESDDTSNGHVIIPKFEYLRETT